MIQNLTLIDVIFIISFFALVCVLVGVDSMRQKKEKN